MRSASGLARRRGPRVEFPPSLLQLCQNEDVLAPHCGPKRLNDPAAQRVRIDVTHLGAFDYEPMALDERADLERLIQVLESRTRVVPEARRLLGMRTPNASEIVILPGEAP